MGKNKRRLTARLPSNWRQLVWDSLPPSRRLRSAVAVLQLSGCRPEELQKGVIVRFEPAVEGYPIGLELTILGAKVGRIRDSKGIEHDRGQERRSILVSLDSPAAQHLLDEFDVAMKSGAEYLHVSYHRKSLSNRLSEVSRIVFPRRREHISAYCYRHQITSDHKAAGVARETIAAMLGQLSDYSQGSYGRPRNGRSATQPLVLGAFATNPVKRSKKTDRLQHFKKPKKTPAP